MLWTDKHFPASVAALAVHAKKVAELTDWIRRACIVAPHGGAMALRPLAPARLLVLAGPPGVGKSTAVRVIAHSLGIEVVTWSDRPVEHVSSLHSARGFAGAAATAEREARLPYVTQVEDFAGFVARACTYTPLALSNPATAASHSRFAGSGQAASTPSLILVEDLPLIDRDDARLQLHAALRLFVARATRPAVLVLSEGGEGKPPPSLLKHVLSGTLRLHPRHPARASNLLPPHFPVPRACACISLLLHDCVQPRECHTAHQDTAQHCRGGGCVRGGGRRRAAALTRSACVGRVAPQELIDDIVSSCRGDLRHAVNSLQFALVPVRVRDRLRAVASCSLTPS